MPRDLVLCDGVAALLKTAQSRLPAVGLAVVQPTADDVKLTHIDLVGISGHRTEPGLISSAFRGVSEPRQIPLEEVTSNPDGLIEARLLMDRMPEDVRAAGRSHQVWVLPLPGVAAGALVIGLSEAGTFTGDEVAVLQDLARDAAGLLQRTESPEEELSRLRRVASLEDVMPALVPVLDIRQIFERLSGITQASLPHDFLSAAVFSEDRLQLEMYAQTSGWAFPEGSGVHYYAPVAVDTFEYHMVKRLLEHPVDAVHGGTEYGARSSLRVPVRLNGRTVAAVNFSSREPDRFTAEDVVVAYRVAQYVALAMSHHRLAEEARRTEELRAKAANLAMLDALLAAVVDTGELKNVIERISDITQRVLPHDAMVLPVLLPGRAQVRFHVKKSPEAAPFPDVVDVPAYLQTSTWDHDLVDDLKADPRQSTFTAARLGYRSALRIPIRVEGELAAGVGFFSLTPALYNESDVPIARRVADRLAISLLREKGLAANKRADEASERASRLESRVQALTDELNARAGFHRVIGKSASWRQVLTQATQVAGTETTVLLLGESGTGKEVVARFLHRASTRKNGPFVALNCAALPEQLLESELFGYERGAFTGAMVSRAGKIEQAAGGVLFLDEVGEMSPPVQAKFLRVLQEREFQRLGGTKTLKADARVVAATNRDPKQAMERGTFREDLYYRLSVFEMSLPPLRERKEDILLLVEAFLADIAITIGRPAGGLSEDARDRILAYHWPGNVRELRNAIERAVILCEGGLISSEHLPISVGQSRPVAVMSPAIAESAPAFPDEGLKLETMERNLVNRALAKASNNKSQAAKLLGLPRGQFYSLLKKHGLTDAKR